MARKIKYSLSELYNQAFDMLLEFGIEQASITKLDCSATKKNTTPELEFWVNFKIKDIEMVSDYSFGETPEMVLKMLEVHLIQQFRPESSPEKIITDVII
jgi:hypothetical protein